MEFSSFHICMPIDITIVSVISRSDFCCWFFFNSLFFGSLMGGLPPNSQINHTEA